eukprot:CAMPEP_0167794880 /NCGR_PEP_ID=MMETSP0111_2-20121227/14083_1 /TAXON_ID=91324 /ORGANISM="Lotharella globosa, Strain CCCM811" /LENGTH=135 /DNA_ID=CAMNT_0007688401 /DNA_START=191 /DNA_END=599 /DNA_ORIENTATION=+
MRTSVIVFSAVVNCALLASICYLAFGGAAVEQPQLSAAMVAKTRMANMVVNGANAVAMKGMKAVDYMHKNAAPTDGKFVNTIKESNPALYKNLVRKRDEKPKPKEKPTTSLPLDLSFLTVFCCTETMKEKHRKRR